MTDTLTRLAEYSRERFDSRHRLVIAASQRAKQLMQGAKPIGTSRFAKETTVALDEVLQGLVGFLVGKDARQAVKEAKRGKEGEVERMVLTGSGEDVQEIKKELSVYVDDSTKPPEPEPEAEAEAEAEEQ
jgi:DNA-directed RNA polymerase subunit omega